MSGRGAPSGAAAFASTRANVGRWSPRWSPVGRTDGRQHRRWKSARDSAAALDSCAAPRLSRRRRTGRASSAGRCVSVGSRVIYGGTDSTSVVFGRSSEVVVPVPRLAIGEGQQPGKPGTPSPSLHLPRLVLRRLTEYSVLVLLLPLLRLRALHLYEYDALHPTDCRCVRRALLVRTKYLLAQGGRTRGRLHQQTLRRDTRHLQAPYDPGRLVVLYAARVAWIMDPMDRLRLRLAYDPPRRALAGRCRGGRRPRRCVFFSSPGSRLPSRARAGLLAPVAGLVAWRPGPGLADDAAYEYCTDHGPRTTRTCSVRSADADKRCLAGPLFPFHIGKFPAVSCHANAV